MTLKEYEIQNSANMELVAEYQDIIRCLGKLIELANFSELKSVSSTRYSECHTKTVQLFLRSIIFYIHESYDCMTIGKFYAANMLLRATLENYFLLSAIDRYPDKQLAELWQFSSIYRKATQLHMRGSVTSLRINECAISLGLDPSTINEEKLKKQNGWLYPLLPKEINMYKLCEYLGEEYLDLYDNDYRPLCEFVHGESIYQKEGTFTFDISLFSMLVRMSVYLILVIRKWGNEDMRVEAQYDKLIVLLQRIDDQNNRI